MRSSAFALVGWPWYSLLLPTYSDGLPWASLLEASSWACNGGHNSKVCSRGRKVLGNKRTNDFSSRFSRGLCCRLRRSRILSLWVWLFIAVSVVSVLMRIESNKNSVCKLRRRRMLFWRIVPSEQKPYSRNIRGVFHGHVYSYLIRQHLSITDFMQSWYI